MSQPGSPFTLCPAVAVLIPAFLELYTFTHCSSLMRLFELGQVNYQLAVVAVLLLPEPVSCLVHPDFVPFSVVLPTWIAIRQPDHRDSNKADQPAAQASQ